MIILSLVEINNLLLLLRAGWMSALLPCVQYGFTTEKLGPQVWLLTQQRF